MIEYSEKQQKEKYQKHKYTINLILAKPPWNFQAIKISQLSKNNPLDLLLLKKTAWVLRQPAPTVHTDMTINKLDCSTANISLLYHLH